MPRVGVESFIRKTPAKELNRYCERKIMERSLDTFNTVESQVVLYDQDVLCQLAEEAHRALARVKSRGLDEVTLCRVVTRHSRGRTFMGMKRIRVHAYELATWEVWWHRCLTNPLVLCSDGNLYFRMAHRDFWHRMAYHMMPIEFADREMRKQALEAMRKFGVTPLPESPRPRIFK